jgi:isoleucyl-tRNA synthetase
MKKYPEFKQLSLPETGREMLNHWQEKDIFAKSISTREGSKGFTFYEGPPSANGKPGIHHVMARTIKDLFCRYKTLRGYQVKRKGGWDTHGLPIEIQVEKRLGITKDDIGKKISIEEYNAVCRRDVLEFKKDWDNLTTMMGYWVDLEHPYVTFENNYIESVWHLLKRLYDKKLLYKGFTIQPYSPAAGTGLSSAEINQPGCYKEVKDTSAIAQFKVIRNEKSAFLFSSENEEVFILAWTTTPWTLPSNVALAVGKNIRYERVRTFNPYTHKPVTLLLAADRRGVYFPEKNAALKLEEYAEGQKEIPFEVTGSYAGSELAEVRYEQLLPYVLPEGAENAFRVIIGDFVTTEDGTGVVHIAPTFGADDFRVARQNGIHGIWVTDDDGNPTPLVDRTGKFVKEMGEFAGRYVKNYKDDPDWVNPDIDISVKLKQENRAFRIEKYEHNYPHCWRTDKPVLYYPLDSWFIKTTAARDRMVELNNTINWKPASTGTGRFGNWLENLVDWNLSRSRYWGIPLPIWRTADDKEELCLGSLDELKAEIAKAVQAGFMQQEWVDKWLSNLDLHRPYVDGIVLVSPSGKPMRRQTDLIDVWFDSGAMPFAQWHYPFENTEIFRNSYPADFIAEGVDQTRGWFFTLHAISVLLEDSVAYRNVLSTGLLLDENGMKMSKRLGNVVDPFLAMGKYGADAVRWYMMSNSPPWENLKFSWTKFDENGKPIALGSSTPVAKEESKGIEEVTRGFFGTLFNTYKLFALYANVDGFTHAEPRLSVHERSEFDRWILSLLTKLVSEVQAELDDYDPTRAARAIEEFVNDHLSNWYVRLNRRRWWKGEMSPDKLAAYQTLYECLVTVTKLMSPIAPFFSDQLFLALNGVTGLEKVESVHLSNWPAERPDERDEDLEQRMELAQRISSLVHSIRKNPGVNIKIRQPLGRVLIPVLSDEMLRQVMSVEDIFLSEVNVKAVKYLRDGDPENPIVKKIKPNFKALGPKLGKNMKDAAAAVAQWGQEQIGHIERHGSSEITVDGKPFTLLLEDVEIASDDIPGWSVAGDGKVTVALDLSLSEELLQEGLARELVNRIQNLRKDLDFNVTDRIRITLGRVPEWEPAVNGFLHYICAETLADSLSLEDHPAGGQEITINNHSARILIER